VSIGTDKRVSNDRPITDEMPTSQELIPPWGRIACGVPYEGFRMLGRGLAELKFKSSKVSGPPICCWS
jgi:hypothetical protein